MNNNDSALHQLAASICGVVEERLGERRERKGGWFCLLDVRGNPTGVIIIHEPFGDLTPEKSSAYCLFSREKAIRLSAHPEHSTSRESRDEHAERYGGAVRAGGFIFSFSGLSEEEDEALALAVAYRCGLLPRGTLMGMTTEGIFRIAMKIIRAGEHT